MCSVVGMHALGVGYRVLEGVRGRGEAVGVACCLWGGWVLVVIEVLVIVDWCCRLISHHHHLCERIELEIFQPGAAWDLSLLALKNADSLSWSKLSTSESGSN